MCCGSGAVAQVLNLAVGKLVALRKSVGLMPEASIRRGIHNRQLPASLAACGANERKTSKTYETHFIGELVEKLFS